MDQLATMNQAQLQILDMLSFIKTPEALQDLNKVISDYFVQKADAELDRMWNEGTLIINWRCGTCQIINLIDLGLERYRNIMPDQLEMWIFQQRNHILLTSRKIVIQTNYFISFF